MNAAPAAGAAPPTAPIRTTCPYCGVGCGVLVGRPSSAAALLDGAGAGDPGHAHVTIAGDPDHPANHGRLCSKGSALGETLGLEGRLLTPQLRRSGQPPRDATWTEALDAVADGFQRIIAGHGAGAVAFYVSGQLLTEDYYVANKLMKGYIGTANIDTNSRLCMSSAVTAHKRAFGEDIVPVSYEDLDAADLVVLVGSNTAWCHPVVYQRLVRAQQSRPNMKIVVIDPRATATCDLADLHLPLASGTDVWLFNGLLSFLHRHAHTHHSFIAAHTHDVGRALGVADNTAGSVAAVARRCGLQGAAVEEFYRLFAQTERVVTVFSQGVNQSSSGTDKANAIINCHLLTGRIGKPGAGPFSITGQPNAMGGREVGGMATMLAAHRELDDGEDRRAVQEFWGSPTIADRPGPKAVELFDAIHAGSIKAVWIAGTNPVVSMPNADKVRDALRRCELVVVSDCSADTDTAALAHVLLPAAAWGEKDGTVSNSERCISRQRKFLEPAGDARPDWWMFAEVARRWGFGASFAYRSAHDIFVEHAALSAHANAGRRAFDLGALAALTPAAYDALAPVRWPLPAATPAAPTTPAAPHEAPRLFADGRFFHADGRARFVPTPPRLPANARDQEFPWVLNTGRIRDQWHTMSRTGKSARLMAHTPEPFIDMHPQDALLAGVRVGEFVRVVTRWGSMVARLRTSGELPRRMIFVPMHWSDVWSADARVGALVNPAVDPLSGEPESKHTPARVEAFVVAWQGFLLSRRPATPADTTWWSLTRGDGFMHYEMAGRRVFGNWTPWARRVTGAPPQADWLEYVDRATGIYRAAYLEDDRLEACVFLSPRPDLPKRSWVSSLFAKESLADADRAGLLMGQPADASADAGPVVCSCFGVGRHVICKAIRSGGLRSTDEIGRRLKAGTNCGSCLPELRALLHDEREPLASLAARR